MNELAMKLQAPFDPADVDFRPQGQPNANGQGRVVAYVDARTVQDRLDEVFGPEGWSFTWEAVAVGKSIEIVKGTITVNGVAKSDVGDAGDTEPSKSAVSDAFKRAAVQWGVGRYLYGLGASYVKVREQGKSWVPADGEVARLRAGLPGGASHRGPQRPTAPVNLPAPTDNASQVLNQKLSAVNSYKEQLGWTPGQLRELAQALKLPARSGDYTIAQADDLIVALQEKLGETQAA